MEDLSSNFEKAAEFARMHIGAMVPDQVLKFYGLYKQATLGRNTEPKPFFWNAVGRQKWDAWACHGDKTKEDAMREYIKMVEGIDPDWEDQPTTSSSWVCHSSLTNEDEPIPESERDIFYWVKENNSLEVEKNIQNGGDVNNADDDGLGLLHWAADRGNANIVRLLLAAGADVNVQDEEGQTPLHFAASCGHVEVATVLLQSGASTSLQDCDGNKARDVASSEEVVDVFDKVGL